jgi:hypothetical protein
MKTAGTLKDYFSKKSEAGMERSRLLNIAEGYSALAQSIAGPLGKGWDWREALNYCEANPTDNLKAHILKQNGITLEALKACLGKNSPQAASDPSVTTKNLAKDIQNAVGRMPADAKSGSTPAQVKQAK